MYSSKTTQQLFDNAKTQTYDAIVVPGVPLENGTWSRTMKGRILWAVYLYQQGIAKNIIFSGTAVSSPYKEGVVMGLFATALGVPAEHVFAETMAEHSTENIYFGYQMARKLGFKKIALASDPFQTKTLKKFAYKRINANVAMIPMVMDTIKILDTGTPAPAINAALAFDSNYIPLKKKYSFFKRLRGTMGNNLKKIED